EARDRSGTAGEGQRRDGGPISRGGTGALGEPRAGPRRRARPRRDLPRHDRADAPVGEGPLRGRGLRSLRRADDQRPVRGRFHRRGRRRQDLRGAAGAGGSHPHRRDRRQCRHAGGEV
ncbi:MAG: Nitrogen regulatory protein P-II, partial [uncultured Solirubrobacterales bacterium]